jgi:hypothetical protein
LPVLCKRPAPGKPITKTEETSKITNGVTEREAEKTLVEQKREFYQDIVTKKRSQPQASQDNFNEILGYMPLREDFDVEYDNEAELFLAEMEFSGKACLSQIFRK